jgi:hypothetical protein
LSFKKFGRDNLRLYRPSIYLLNYKLSGTVRLKKHNKLVRISDYNCVQLKLKRPQNEKRTIGVISDIQKLNKL